ncbi:ABC transporter permease [Candidatus Pacearchaeota archaeon]|nr:ABC transporter permease [Candidatus Pacearchaeota archaeon]
MIQDFFSMAIRSIAKRRLRTFLTLIGIVISIATIFTLISLSLGLNVSINNEFEKLGGDKFFVQPRGQLGPPGTAGAIQLTIKDIDAIKKIPGVKEVTYYTIGNAKIEFKDETRFVMVASTEIETTELYFDLYGVDLEEGRLLKKGDTNDIIIGSQYKHNNFLGTPVKVGDKITINGADFEVQGIMKTIGSAPDDRMITMPEPEFRELFKIPDRIDFIIVQIENAGEINNIAERTERQLLKSRGLTEKTQDFTIITPEELLESFSMILDILTYFLLGISLISLLVGGINIANTMFASVLERTREIGVMKAIGAQNKDILTIFLIEAGLLGIVGGLLGIGLGIAAGQIVEYVALTQLGTGFLTVSTPLYLIAGCLAFAFLAGAVSGLWPAWKATKIRPVEALRYE